MLSSSVSFTYVLAVSYTHLDVYKRQGADDAVAIMLALLAPELEVIGICSVNGNREVRLTTDNTLRVLDLLGRGEVPVYRGCEYPMVSTLKPGRKPNIPWREGMNVSRRAIILITRKYLILFWMISEVDD